MKKQLSLVLFGIAAISLTGCYTQVAVQENDDIYVYHEPIPIIIYYPVPDPILIPVQLPYPPQKPVEPVYKIRKPNTRPHTGDIRKPGKTRNPVTPPQRDDIKKPDKIREPVTPPPNSDRIGDDIRNSGGRNEGGRKSRR